MERIFYKTSLRDPITNYPIYIFDTSYLPSPDDINYDEFLLTLMQLLPIKPYVLIIFSCGLNKLSWIWGLKFIKNLLDLNDFEMQKLIKIFIVHDSWFLKSLTSILNNFNSTRKNLEQINKLLDTFTINSKSTKSEKFQTLVIHCDSLSTLSHYLDLTNLKISLNVYKYNLQFEKEITFSMTILPIINPTITLNPNTHPIFNHHLYQLFNIINENCIRTQLIFHKPGNKINTDILYSCILRNQLVWINDWDLYSISTVFKKILMELPHPLINVESIKLPIVDSIEYYKDTFTTIIQSSKFDTRMENYHLLLLQLFQMLYKMYINQHITKHTSSTLSKCLSHCISHELISNKTTNRIQIVNRFIKGVIENWKEISQEYTIPSIQDIIQGKLVNESTVKRVENFDTSYDVNYDLTFDEEDEEERVKINTTNILNNLDLNKVHLRSQTDAKVKQLETPNKSDKVNQIESKRNEHFKENETTKKKKTTKKNDPIMINESILESELVKDPVQKPLSNVSNIHIQFPPQKYKFEPGEKKIPQPEQVSIISNSKKPVIRGRKVGQLAKLFEERCEGIEILNRM